jgi:hypothetical protein
VEAWLKAFSASVLRGGTWSTSLPSSFILGGKTPSQYFLDRRLGEAQSRS